MDCPRSRIMSASPTSKSQQATTHRRETSSIYEQNLYGTTYDFQEQISNQADALNIQSKYLLMITSHKPTEGLPGNNLLETADQLNDSDAEILNLLAAEGDCTDILQNIANNEQFERLINDGTEFGQVENLTQNMQEFMTQENYNGIGETIPEIEAPQGPGDANLNKIVLDDIDAIVKAAQEKFQRFECAYCQKTCPTRKLLKFHLMSHAGVRPHTCDICGKSFKHNYAVKVHKRSHDGPTFQCDICSKMFIHKSHLTAHRRKHLGDFVTFCKDCNKGFISQSAYRNHVKIQHEKVLNICDECGVQLSSTSALNEHKLTHDPNYRKQRSHVCEVCGKSYLNSRNLRSHMKIHTQMNNYICNICGKSLSGKKVLETHVKMHTGEKDFACKYCGKCFSSKEYLTVHERIHTGEKPFACQMCSKSFTQKTSLTVHMRYHSGERPYKCQCGKEFVTKTHLLGHYKTHEAASMEFSYVPQDLE